MSSQYFISHSTVAYCDVTGRESDITSHHITSQCHHNIPLISFSHSTVAYCDVTGRESRLPLKIKGEGIGPKLKFSFDTLDIQNVFVNSAHAYEVSITCKDNRTSTNLILTGDSCE